MDGAFGPGGTTLAVRLNFFPLKFALASSLIRLRASTFVPEAMYTIQRSLSISSEAGWDNAGSPPAAARISESDWLFPSACRASSATCGFVLLVRASNFWISGLGRFGKFSKIWIPNCTFRVSLSNKYGPTFNIKPASRSLCSRAAIASRSARSCPAICHANRNKAMGTAIPEMIWTTNLTASSRFSASLDVGGHANLKRAAPILR